MEVQKLKIFIADRMDSGKLYTGEVNRNLIVIGAQAYRESDKKTYNLSSDFFTVEGTELSNSELRKRLVLLTKTDANYYDGAINAFLSRGLVDLSELAFRVDYFTVAMDEGAYDKVFIYCLEQNEK